MSATAIPGIERVLFTEEQIDHRIREVAAEISRDYAGKVVKLVGVLKGSIFFLTALARHIEVPVKVDIVDCFRKIADIMPIADDAIAIGAKVLWQQLSVTNEEAARKAEAAGIEAVMDRCVKIEHARIFGGLHWAGVNTRVISARRAA